MELSKDVTIEDDGILLDAVGYYDSETGKLLAIKIGDNRYDPGHIIDWLKMVGFADKSWAKRLDRYELDELLFDHTHGF